MKNVLSLFIIMMTMSSCSIIQDFIGNIYEEEASPQEMLGYGIIDIGDLYVGMDERRDRAFLRNFLGVDPVQTEWCAAYVNSVLEQMRLPGSDSVSDYPLLARSFMTWGEEVIGEPMTGDIVVFPRGTAGWQGHVGFFVVSFYENGKEYYVILGGNQSNEVSYAAYEAKRAIAIRRWPVL